MNTNCNKLKKLKHLIPDDNLRHIVFNFDDTQDDFLTDESICLHYLQNLLTFSSLVILNVFLNWKKEKQNSVSSEFSNSMLRMYNMLNRAYNPNKMTGDFVDNIIINLMIDHSLNLNEASSFSEALGIWGFFCFPPSNNKLTKYIYMLKQWRLSSRYNYNCPLKFEDLCECIDMFSFLKEFKADIINLYTKNDMLGKIILSSIGNKYQNTTIDLNYTLVVERLSVIKPYVYYMYDFDFEDTHKARDNNKQKDQLITLNYVCFDNNTRCKLQLSDAADFSFGIFDDDSGYYAKNVSLVEEFLISYDILNINLKAHTPLFFKDYILLNNKYIKELSLTISDALKKNTKDSIIQHLSQYHDIFDKMTVTSFYTTGTAIGRRWDEIVLFLLLEEGIYDFLKFLLEHQSYESFLAAFNNRFGRRSVQEICEKEPFLKDAEKRSSYIHSKQGRLNYQANALIMLATKLLTPGTINLIKTAYPTSIDDVIEEVENIFRSQKHSADDKVFCIANTVMRVTMFLNTFFRGVMEYIKNRKSTLLTLEEDGEIDFSDYRHFTRVKESWIDEFRTSVNESTYGLTFKFGTELNAVRGQSGCVIRKQLSATFDALIDTNTNFTLAGSSDAELLYDTLGKRQLFDNPTMIAFQSSIINSLEKNMLYSLFNNVQCFLNYLKTGVYYKNGIATHYSIEDAIYPLVGQYFSSVTSRDGYQYSYFKVDTCVNTHRKSLNIKMITDDRFDFGQTYFCVPNANRVTGIGKSSTPIKDLIWISPIIIPCSIFLPEITTEIEPLDDPSDFEDAAKLIYDSDPYIYSSLFGSCENAQKVFPELFKTKNCKFYKNHYFIVKKDHEVIAIAAMYKSDDCVWDTDVIIKAFGNAGVELPSTFNTAVFYMEDIFNEAMGNSLYMLDDLCVKKQHRNNGIGRSLIRYIIKEAERNGASVVLSAYSENDAAFNLYTYLGFIPYSKNATPDASGKDYFKMIKI